MMNQPQIGPGEKLSSRAKEALAKDNVRITQQAHEEAARQREVDMRMDSRTPMKRLEESIKEKVQRGDFNQR